MRFIKATAVLALSLALPQAAAAQLPQKPELTLEAAKSIAVAAETEATKNNWSVVIAVVDDGGHLVYLQRLDGTQLGSVAVAQEKARTAALFRRPTKEFADRLAGGATQLLSLPGMVAIEGGVPLVISGEVVGAVGVSGGTPAQDGQVAQAGASAMAALQNR
jgi:glc operon protein GlcG